MKKRVVIGMSGGVDSSVAAALLKEQGYDVIGITIKTYNYDEVGGNALNETSCCSIDGINDARVVCNNLGIPHYVLDFSETFKQNIIDGFVEEYLAGNTPNPCVICNRKIKWEHMIEKAATLGADYISMGHYARVLQDDASGRYYISRGNDPAKDQSYALWAVSQESLSKTIFPLADMSKEDIRGHAERFGLHIAKKRESYEICFIPDNDYTRFLRDNVEGLEDRVKGGDVVFEGEKIGEHDGYPFYTIGQRRGLNVAVGEPVFVTEIDYKTNTISVGRQEDLMHTAFIADTVNMQKYPPLTEPVRVIAKIRYKDAGAPATLYPVGDGTVRVAFDEPRRAITRGQSTVWYDGDDVVGGGIIRSIED
ncbi:MAG: tRNA 2-thiouridine(34) synthase MnmA [Ectothiorhodospiraceae bacterium]|nr:tRNA 2-thiouridine(34) synthase MnmA [Ectothiorhodospiraceae bacterium]